ncbi:HD domain-containing protein [Desulfolutivibrio sulfoxidireducens]|nr:HD-GYP domain-containing protein [Desulfolutivibrio sulfoxidireducens]QLA20181.1 HD domain-containing protein [Desulfolutivibrio sulfoxidireducens]
MYLDDTDGPDLGRRTKILDFASHVSESALCLPLVVHQMAESLGWAIDAKDPRTWSHSEDVARIARYLALAMGLSRDTAEIVHVAGHLHDMGKIGVPDMILLKPGPLTRDEWDMIRAHPVVGARIVSPISRMNETGVTAMVLHHHERYDGRGYPDGLAGEEIPLGARIIAVADSLSAMLQERSYRKSRSFAEASREILRCRETQFDPEVVDAFTSIAPRIESLIGTMRHGRCCRLDERPLAPPE